MTNLYIVKKTRITLSMSWVWLIVEAAALLDSCPLTGQARYRRWSYRCVPAQASRHGLIMTAQVQLLFLQSTSPIYAHGDSHGLERSSSMMTVRTVHMCVCVCHCVQLLYTTQHTTVLIKFTLNLETNTTAA